MCVCVCVCVCVSDNTAGRSLCPWVLDPEVTRASSLVPCFIGVGIQNMDPGTSETERPIQ